MSKPRAQSIRGFTLIELSIVLVIIGLVVGGVLVGRDLLSAAAARAQISQIQKYQQAVNTFRGKYGYLPGDIPDPDATQFGFLTRGTNPGQGDGNGLLASSSVGAANGALQSGGELFGFWRDLGDAQLIDYRSTFTDFTNTVVGATSGNVKNVLPPANVGRGNYLYVYSGGSCCGSGYVFTTKMYIGLSVFVSNSNPGWLSSNPGLTVAEALAIDQKLDDGLPQSGVVTASYLNIGANGYSTGYGGPVFIGAGGLGATAGATTTCYDNNNAAGAVQKYSITQNNGAGVNCALSFKLQ